VVWPFAKSAAIADELNRMANAVRSVDAKSANGRRPRACDVAAIEEARAALEPAIETAEGQPALACAPQDESGDWLTNTQAAQLLIEELEPVLLDETLTLNRAKARISRAGSLGKFSVKGPKGPGRRIERRTFLAWVHELYKRARDSAHKADGMEPPTSDRRGVHRATGGKPVKTAQANTGLAISKPRR